MRERGVSATRLAVQGSAPKAPKVRMMTMKTATKSHRRGDDACGPIRVASREARRSGFISVR